MLCDQLARGRPLVRESREGAAPLKSEGGGSPTILLAPIILLAPTIPPGLGPLSNGPPKSISSTRCLHITLLHNNTCTASFLPSFHPSSLDLPSRGTAPSLKFRGVCPLTFSFNFRGAASLPQTSGSCPPSLDSGGQENCGGCGAMAVWGHCGAVGLWV